MLEQLRNSRGSARWQMVGQVRMEPNRWRDRFEIAVQDQGEASRSRLSRPISKLCEDQRIAGIDRYRPRLGTSSSS
jgi:hypothetical protein